MTAVHVPRHRHSPRIRHRARARGIALSDVIGTGPGGRVTEADLDRAGAAPARPRVTGGVAAVQVAVAPDGDRESLLAVVAAAGLEALRRSGFPATAVALTRAGGTVAVPDAHDLTVDALRDRLAGSGPGVATSPLRVLDAPEFDLRIGVPAPGEVAVVAVGAVTERVEVERGPSGAVAFAARPSVTVTVAAADELPEPVSADLLAHVARRLAASWR